MQRVCGLTRQVVSHQVGSKHDNTYCMMVQWKYSLTRRLFSGGGGGLPKRGGIVLVSNVIYHKI